MDKNLLLAVALSIAVYAAWFGLVEKRVAPVPMKTVAEAPRDQSQQSVAAPAGSNEAPGPSPTAAPQLDRKVLLEQSDELSFNSEKVRIHPQGAAIVSALYHGPLGAVELIEDPHPGLFAAWTELRFERDAKAAGVYHAARADGLRVTKEFALPQADNSLPRLRIRLENPTKKSLSSGEWTLSIGPGLGTVASEQSENASVWRALGLVEGEGGLKGKIEIFKKPGAHAGPFQWVGVDNRYFLAAVIPPRQGFGPVIGALPPQITLRAASVELPPGGEQVWELPFYLGAKANNVLTRYHAGLERSIDFGFFAQLGRLVLRALGGIHSLVGNWGWAIILLTLMLQVLLFPLTYKSLKAAAAMKRLQPEIAKLQQKYSKDQTRLNTETMELYKKSGANPLGGCLPMLLQMPIFIALFNALRNSWELHGATWIFWVRDLSAKDPYYVLPIVMGGLMLLQQKLAPAPTADPAQAKIMMWMPVIFTFMFLNFPAGLVLYWLTNSVFSTIQQLALKDHFERQQ